MTKSKHSKNGPKATAYHRASRKNAKQQRKVSSKVRAYAKMITDPCNCELTPGLYGDARGLLARLKSTSENTSNGTAGYAIWIPAFHNDPSVPVVGTTVAGNLFVYVTNAPGTPPAGVYGLTSPWTNPGTTAGTLPDPCSVIASQSMVMDARLISACMKMTYRGKLESSSGEVAFIDNLSPSVLFGRHTVGAPQTPAASVDNLFIYGNRTQRIGLDTIENVYYPGDKCPDFHTVDQGVVLDVASYPALDQPSLLEQPTAFGFAWRGLENDTTSKLMFEFTKNIEWRPDPYIGVSQPAVRTYGQNPVPSIVAALDAAAPQWNHKTVEEKNGTTSLTKAVFSGVDALGRVTKAINTSGFSFDKFIDTALSAGIGLIPDVANLLAPAAPLLLM